MKKTKARRYICPSSDVFEMEGFNVLQAGSPIIIGPGKPDSGPSDPTGSGNQTTNEEELDPDSPENEIWP